MPKRKAAKTWAEEIAELDDPAPRDFDPEDEAAAGSSSDDGGSLDSDVEPQADAREHYEDVGKSTLRKPDTVPLGPQYQGSRVSRNDLVVTVDDGDSGHDSPREGASSDEDEYMSLDGEVEEQGVKRSESDEVMGERSEDEVDESEGNDSDDSFETQSKQDKEIRSIKNGAGGEYGGADDSSDQDGDDSETEEFANFSEGDSETSTRSSNSPEEAPASLNDRAALRQMMAESQKSIIATISAATKADLVKGNAVKQQRSTFDTLLNTRIRLQKSLIATNSFSYPSKTETQDPPSESLIRAAETAALNLWTQLDGLRHSLQDPSSSKKRPFEATLSTPSSALWTCMQTHEANATPQRRAILSKWSTKLHPPTQLRPNLSTSSHTPLPAVLDQHLSTQNTTLLIERTRIPRSCAPLQASTRHAAADASIYDDSDFYTVLLRDLVDRRMSEPHALPNTATSIPPTMTAELTKVKRRRPNVDTKASKGRKMRYTVHEKLRDVMVREDRGSWGEKQVAELFGSLLGRKVQGLKEGMEEDEDLDGRREEDGSILFRR